MAERPFRDWLDTIALWFGVILTSGVALYGTRPPAALSASAAVDAFSAARAMSHLRQIARQPHPIGSAEAARVREYLVEQLSELGGAVRVEQAIGCVQYGRNTTSGLVSNIIATFPGQSNSRAIMLVAHYDSVAEGPGAADDGAGLVVTLEAIRALRAGPPIKNDLVVLFSDGEEARGLLGAEAFAAAHPDLANGVGMMVNLEARGGSGPALMFETSNDNGALIREFARAAPYPMASSLMASIYKLLPNDTDFTPLKTAGLTGLNFAFLETFQNYHSRLDTIENLDPRSVQHMGANVLGVIRHFGNLAQPQAKQPDVVYFNSVGSQLVVYPVWLAWVIALLAPLLFAFKCLRSAPRIGLTLGRTAIGFASFFAQFLIMVGGSVAAFASARRIAGEFLEGDTLSNHLLFLGVMGIAFGFAIGSHRVLQRKVGAANVSAGQLCAVAVFAILLCRFLVGGSYVFEWPLVFGMAGMFLGLGLKEAARSVCQFVFLLPALLILVPLAYMFFVSLTFTYAALAAVAFLLTTLLAIASPLFDRLFGRSKISLLIIFLVSALFLGAGIHLSQWSAAHPRPDSLIYSVNADENKAKWVSYDAAPDAWTTHVLGSTARSHSDRAFTAGLDRPVLTSNATLLPLEAPFVAMSQNFVSDGEQTITLQIASRRDARSLIVRLPAELKLRAGGWNGNVQTIHDSTRPISPWTFRFYNAPPEGVTLELRFAAQNGTRIWVADTTSGLPAIAPFSPRPDGTTPAYGSDITLVAKPLEL